MVIYQAEIDAGLTETLSAKSSIVYACLLEKCEDENSIVAIKKDNQSIAGIQDSDLYHTNSILVTTSWNKNDDIFDPKEVWLAKSTPTHKPTNIEHNEAAIVGHITSTWPINNDGSPIDENTPIDKLPEKFHILTGSVIYNGYTEPELKSRAQNLIDEIESGNKYVSMECFFKGFDYGLLNKTNGSYHILPRNEETAFLTKHLRAYGGQGTHEHYKIGRVLRQITFSGKGFVDKPANPESIIFTKDNLPFHITDETMEKDTEKNNDSEKEGVLINQANLKETNMSVESTETVDNVEAKQEMQLPHNIYEEANKMQELQHTEKDARAEDETVEAKKAEKKDMEDEEEEDTKSKSLKAALDAITQELVSARETIAGYKKKEELMAKQEKKMKRMAALTAAGFDADSASATVDKFEGLDDEAFEAVTSLVAGKMPPWLDKNKKDDTKKDKSKASEDNIEALENVEVEDDINLSVGSEVESEMQSTRAALVDFVCTRLGKKLNKGE